MNLIFRLLRPDEIEVRIGLCNQYGIQLLLYKDARCDMNILDETVGPLNWQRHHSRDNKNCLLSIWDPEKQQWIEKEDTGTESFSESEKGLASDSFKRVCVNVGIGRELYTAKNLFVFNENLKTHRQENNRWKCNDTFDVIDIQYNDKRQITYIKIYNQKMKNMMEFRCN